MNRHLQAIGEALEKERRAELDSLRERLFQAVMNLPCDLSAFAPAHHIGVKEGHKQARHKILDIIADIWPA